MSFRRKQKDQQKVARFFQQFKEKTHKSQNTYSRRQEKKVDLNFDLDDNFFY